MRVAPVPAGDRGLEAEIAAILQAVEARLGALFPEAHAPDLVGAAMRQAVRAPGKRLRTLMAILGARDLGWAGPAAIDVACAVELVHTASLVLDDLPCMDDSGLRRGCPAIHVAFGEDVAVLAAIALLARAYGLIAAAPDLMAAQRTQCVAILSDAIGPMGLVGGQIADLRGAAGVTPGRAMEVNERKTGALFVAALEMACVLAEGSAEWRGRYRDFGRELGQAFQILDDLIDLSGDAAAAGKPTGKDAGKPTLVRLIGPEAGAARLAAHVEAAIALLAQASGGAPRLTHLVRRVFDASGARLLPAPLLATSARRAAAT